MLFNELIYSLNYALNTSKKDLNSGIYYITFTIKRWYYLFDRHNRWNILLDSLKYCQQNKGIKIYAWVFMMNHIHLIIESSNVSGFIRDFKKFTSKEFKKNITETEPNVLKIFIENGVYEFWNRTNMPKRIESEEFLQQKKNYIEQNPVRKNYVKNAQDWVYSSANPENLLKLERL